MPLQLASFSGLLPGFSASVRFCNNNKKRQKKTYMPAIHVCKARESLSQNEGVVVIPSGS